MTTNHERLQDEVIPGQEKQKPAEVSPVIGLRMQTDRARDLQAQRSGEISSCYDLGEAPIPEGERTERTERQLAEAGIVLGSDK